MYQKLLFCALILILAAAGFGQATTDKSSEDAAKLEKDAVEFLRETSADVGSMRSMENRISFNAELASLMWFHDEKEAKAMYGGVVADFKQLLAQFDAEMNAAAVPDEDSESDGGGGGFFGGGGGRSKIERKFQTAMGVRQQIAMSLAEHAPDLAYNFYYDSLNLVTNAKFRKETEESDKTFGLQLIKQIAEADPGKGVEYGKDSLRSGLDSTHIELLKKIYDKDPDKAMDLGAAILSKLRSEKSDKPDDMKFNFYSNLLTFGSENLQASKNAGGKKPVYSAGDLHDIADQFARAVLDSDNGNESYLSYVDQIEKFAPGRGAQIKAKFAKGSVNSNVATDNSGSAVTNSTTVTTPDPTPENPTGSVARTMLENAEREKAELKTMDEVKGLGTKSLPKDERDKIVAQARKVISQTHGKDKKITALSMLAAQVAKAGDKDLASEIMRDAERMVNPQPKNYQDFLLSWMLASGYAEADPDKAFPLLESTILRANETISAFVKVAEFIDTSDEMVVDGEVQVGLFGGGMIKDLTSGLGMATGTIRTLAKADFAKTKNLASTFDRTEIRILAKMLVLRAVLDKNAKPDPAEMPANGGSLEARSARPATRSRSRPN